MIPAKLVFQEKTGENSFRLKEFIPTMLISAKCKVKNCNNKGDFRDMANGVCDSCWVANEEWRMKND